MQRASCLVFEKDGKPEGYAFVRENGRIGPLAVLRESSFENAMSNALTYAADQGADNVLTLLPGSNEQAVSASMKHGLRITSPMLFMSSKPMGAWKNYLFYSPGLM